MLAVTPLPFSPLTPLKYSWVQFIFNTRGLYSWCISLQLLTSERVASSPS